MTQSYLPPLPPYPTSRLRRNRRDAWSRSLVAENTLTAGDLIWPVFVHDEPKRASVDTMPGAYRHSLSSLVDAVSDRDRALLDDLERLIREKRRAADREKSR